jgi:hypothetical protein
VEDGIPFTSFAVDDVAAEYERLVGRGVRFTQPPTDMGAVTTAVFDDTCGNLVQIAAENDRTGSPTGLLRAGTHRRLTGNAWDPRGQVTIHRSS